MAPNKIRAVIANPESNNESDSDNDMETDSGPYTGNEEIQVDFDGRNPIDTDFHGIRQLLQQLFLKAHINLSEMSELIIAQNFIGSVVTQSDEGDEDDEDEDDEMYESNLVFGVTSAINITFKKEVTCIKEFKTYLLDKADKNADIDTLTFLRNILNDEKDSVGFLINERFINIPAQISVPLMENLHKEIKQASAKKMPFEFKYFIMIIKFYRKEAKGKEPAEDVFSNQEEEVICTEALNSFEYSVETEADTGMSGDWLEGDSTMKPFRKVIVFDAQKLPKIVLSIQEFINQ